jgi:hypothetical protein
MYRVLRNLFKKRSRSKNPTPIPAYDISHFKALNYSDYYFYVRNRKPFPRFLDLPAELREMVYIYLFHLEVELNHYLYDGKDTHALPAITRTSRLLRQESIPLFFKAHTFVTKEHLRCANEECVNPFPHASPWAFNRMDFRGPLAPWWSRMPANQLMQVQNMHYHVQLNVFSSLDFIIQVKDTQLEIQLVVDALHHDSRATLYLRAIIFHILARWEAALALSMRFHRKIVMGLALCVDLFLLQIWDHRRGMRDAERFLSRKKAEELDFEGFLKLWPGKYTKVDVEGSYEVVLDEGLIEGCVL